MDACIKEGILAEFLAKNRAEVISVSIFEYDKEEEEKKLRKEEFDLGKKEGHEEGEEQMAILCQRLLADNRVDDLERCTEDAEYRKLLMAEYGVTETAPVA